MHDFFTVLASVVAAFGAQQLFQLLTIKRQKRNLDAGTKKINAETSKLEAETTALLLEPFRESIKQAARVAESAQVEAGDAKADAYRANQRADRAERRLAAIEQFIEGPMRAWAQGAVHQVHERGGDIAPPPRFQHQEN